MNAVSLEGGVKVLVLLMDWYVSRPVVSSSFFTTPFSSYHVSIYGFESRPRTHAFDACARSSAVRMPYLLRYAAVFGPIPQISPTEMAARKRGASERGMIVSPWGLFHLEPTFASVFVA